MTLIRTYWLDCLLVIGLMAIPLLRDVAGSVLSGGSWQSVIHELNLSHSGLEAVFMGAIGFGLSWFRHRQKWALDTNRLLEIRVTKRTEEIRITQHTAIEALAALCEYNDTDTGDHIRRIREYVRLLSQWMQHHSRYSDYLSQRPDYVSELATASMLHDIGKTAIPGHILSKQGPLNSAEYNLMKTHTTIAGELFLKANREFIEKTGRDSYMALARDIAFYHHERWDGGGYPKGLSGEDIPLSARIVAVADVYDALTSRRPYKEPWSHSAATAEIINGSGTQFDPSVVDAFKTLNRECEAISASMRADVAVDTIVDHPSPPPIDNCGNGLPAITARPRRPMPNAPGHDHPTGI